MMSAYGHHKMVHYYKARPHLLRKAPLRSVVLASTRIADHRPRCRHPRQTKTCPHFQSDQRSISEPPAPMICRCLPLLLMADNLCLRFPSMPMSASGPSDQGSVLEPPAPMICRCLPLLLMANNLCSRSFLHANGGDDAEGSEPPPKRRADPFASISAGE